jgi:hypothetical protein
MNSFKCNEASGGVQHRLTTKLLVWLAKKASHSDQAGLKADLETKNKISANAIIAKRCFGYEMLIHKSITWRKNI